jgi:hypothetical protein
MSLQPQEGRLIVRLLVLRDYLSFLHKYTDNNRCFSCIIVDSTRRGKRLPDALSKTIPIWCAVINRAISLNGYESDAWDSKLYTLPSIISSSEHAQIAVMIDGFARNMLVCHDASFIECKPKRS